MPGRQRSSTVLNRAAACPDLCARQDVEFVKALQVLRSGLLERFDRSRGGGGPRRVGRPPGHLAEAAADRRLRSQRPVGRASAHALYGSRRRSKIRSERRWQASTVSRRRGICEQPVRTDRRARQGAADPDRRHRDGAVVGVDARMTLEAGDLVDLDHAQSHRGGPCDKGLLAQRTESVLHGERAFDRRVGAVTVDRAACRSVRAGR